MSETSEYRPLEASQYTLPSKEEMFPLEQLGEVERSVAALYLANAAILSNFAEPDIALDTLSRRRALALMGASLLVLTGCAKAQEQQQVMNSPEVVPTGGSTNNNALETPTTTTHVSRVTERPTNRPTEVPVATQRAEITPVRTPEAPRVPEWARGMSFGEILFAAEDGGIAPEVKTAFTTPDGVAIEISSKPRALADIRAAEGNVNPYDFRRPDNAVLQNWDRDTKKIVPVQTVHSANGNTGPLSGEGIRQWLEETGGIFGGARTAEEMRAQADSLVGAEVTITQGEITESGRIAMVLRADTNKLEAHMRVLHPDQTKYPNQFLTYDYLHFFDRSSYWNDNADKEYVMYMFCGRDASDEKNNGRDKLETHRWLVVVESK